jgi:hypothetical protein
VESNLLSGRSIPNRVDEAAAVPQRSGSLIACRDAGDPRVWQAPHSLVGRSIRAGKGERTDDVPGSAQALSTESLQQPVVHGRCIGISGTELLFPYKIEVSPNLFSVD